MNISVDAEALGTICAIGSFCGGFVGQLVSGATYVRKQLADKCAIHDKRLQALERRHKICQP